MRRAAISCDLMATADLQGFSGVFNAFWSRLDRVRSSRFNRCTAADEEGRLIDDDDEVNEDAWWRVTKWRHDPSRDCRRRAIYVPCSSPLQMEYNGSAFPFPRSRTSRHFLFFAVISFLLLRNFFFGSFQLGRIIRLKRYRNGLYIIPHRYNSSGWLDYVPRWDALKILQDFAFIN